MTLIADDIINLNLCIPEKLIFLLNCYHYSRILGPHHYSNFENSFVALMSRKPEAIQ